MTSFFFSILQQTTTFDISLNTELDFYSSAYHFKQDF